MNSATVLKGALAGATATAPMSLFMKAGFELLPEEEQYPLPPREITQKLAEPVEHLLSEEEMQKLTWVNHFSYGAAMGVGLALLLSAGTKDRYKSFSKDLGLGLAYGAAVWVGSYMGWLPAAKILKPATEHPMRRNAMMIVAHLVWGASAVGALRSLK